MLSLIFDEHFMIIVIEWADTGVGCCANPGPFIYNGWSTGLDDCKARCVDNSNCGWINYATTRWCSIILKTADCSERNSGPRDCGAGGQIFRVHKYLPRHGNTFDTSNQFMITKNTFTLFFKVSFIHSTAKCF